MSRAKGAALSVLAAASVALAAGEAGAECVETVASGAERPQMIETFPDRATSGYAAVLHLVISHGKGRWSFRAAWSCSAKAIRRRH
jgi:hypothetical protein